MVIVTKGDYIWVEPAPPAGEHSVPVGARVLDAGAGRVRVLDDRGEDVWLGPDRRIKIMHPTSVQGVEDMIELGDLHEAGILRTLLVRYREKLIYTYTGSILVAVNPYQDLPIYTVDQVRAYRGRRIGELPPHIFAVADGAYANMCRSQRDQCIIISGESGAGKTESTKLVLQFLAATSGQHSWIEQQILLANPIMEAFGNAKTVRNDNSSRFGKYVDVHFSPAGAIEGAKVQQYLLERSRIVQQAADERNYHIFYCLLAGLSADEKKEFYLSGPTQYFYLSQGKSMKAEGRDDGADFADIRSAMKVLLFSEMEIRAVWQMLSGLLHMGNVRYTATQVNNMDATEIAEADAVAKAAKLLQVDQRSLVNALTTRTIVTRSERVVSGMTAEQSLDVRDAFVKAVYGRLFDWLVRKINAAIYKPCADGAGRLSIGILDIFGFENFATNSFEQLCINYANESLQQFFVAHIFKIEQDEYDGEDISWRHIEFVDNQDVLDLLAVRPMNILSLIDEEAKFPKGTDQTMLNKLHVTHAQNKQYLKPRSDLSKAFGVRHFAGAVFYDVRNFLEKNRDTFSHDLLALVHKSQFKFLVSLFTEQEQNGLRSGRNSTLSMASNATGTTRRGPSVGAQFKKSLDELMGQLSKCEPFFIRCIKPNESKKPLAFDRDLCVKQLRYSGMMETIRIRKAGYPIRHEYHDFVLRYRAIVNGIPPPHKTDCRWAAGRICDAALGPDADYQLGKTKLFLKDAHDLHLEQALDVALARRAVTIQKQVRAWRQRRRYQRMRAAAVCVQRHYRGHAERNRYKQVRLGFARLQAIIRTRQLVFQYNRLRELIIQFQAQCRGALLRRCVRERISAGEKRLAGRQEEALERELAEQRRKSAHLHNGAGHDEIDDSKLVEQMFGFLPSDGGSEAATPSTAEPTTPPAQDKLPSPSLPNGQPKPVGSATPQHVESRVMPPTDDLSDLENYQFGKFAATYFQGNATPEHLRKALRYPLLPHENNGDQIAALAVWITILRFMGDLPEPKLPSDAASIDGAHSPPAVRDTTPVMAKLYSTLGRSFSKKDFLKAQAAADADVYSVSGQSMRSAGSQSQLNGKSAKGTMRQKLISMTLKKKSKLSDDVMQSLQKENFADTYNAMLENRPTNNLEKLHFIIGHGILRPDLRDEIYCQICKQLTNNPSKSSHARGWVLLSLCVGCFAPSHTFVRYLRAFVLQKGPPGYGAYCEQRLRRTLANGTRHQPPSYMELQATKSKKALILPVTFMDGSTKTLLADSATTARELCHSLAEKIGLVDRFGFSLYIALFDKVSSLGSGNDHVMDAVSQCEQYAKEQGSAERHAPWRLFFRKEIFSPWHKAQDDATATNLIYQQVIRGIKYGEYRCEKEEELATLVAQQYHVEHGGEMKADRLHQLLPNLLPEHVLSAAGKSAEPDEVLQRWLQLVLHAYRKCFQSRTYVEPLSVKQDVVTFAKHRWPLLFSRFYEAFRFAGPPLPRNEVIVAVNWTGVYAVDDNEQVLVELAFPEVTHVAATKTGRLHGDLLTIGTVRGDEYAFQSPNAEDIEDLVRYFLDGLRRRSHHAIALYDLRPEDAGDLLAHQRGDLLILEGGFTGESVRAKAQGGQAQWAPAENARTGDRGQVRCDPDALYVLPTLARPGRDVLELFARQSDADAARLQQRHDGRRPAATGTMTKGDGRPPQHPVGAAHTLEAFAAEHFRSLPRRPDMNGHGTLTSQNGPASRKRRGAISDEVWRHAKEPIRAPLLRKLAGKEEPSQEAVMMFLAIMKYMGDHPSRRPRYNTELTDQIFAGPLRYEVLRDECYCQLMKQLTHNGNRMSEDRGWELFWLAAGLFAPGAALLKETAAFLRSRHHPVAADCFNRLQKIVRAGARKYAPHQVEVEAVQHRTTQIFHKVYFPDDSDAPVEVESATRAGDFCARIAARLRLQSAEGFALFVKVADKVISVPESDFFFDFICQLTEWMRKARPSKDGSVPNFSYQVFFMRKLWTNVVPGEDPNADMIFHYHQELPKYLRGYHSCNSLDQAAELAAYILRAKFSATVDSLQQNNEECVKNALAALPNVLTEILPRDLFKQRSASDWRRAVTGAFTAKAAGMSCEEAKTAFLKAAFGWPTFGSAFFEVRQTSDPTLPEKLLVAINKNGVNLIAPETKEIIVTYPFTRISNWSSGNTYFHMTVGNLMKGNRLLLETSLPSSGAAPLQGSQSAASVSTVCSLASSSSSAGSGGRRGRHRCAPPPAPLQQLQEDAVLADQGADVDAHASVRRPCYLCYKVKRLFDRHPEQKPKRRPAHQQQQQQQQQRRLCSVHAFVTQGVGAGDSLRRSASGHQHHCRRHNHRRRTDDATRTAGGGRTAPPDDGRPSPPVNLGYKMDDLLTSYIGLMLAQMQKTQSPAHSRLDGTYL